MQSLINALITGSAYLLICTAYAVMLLSIALMFDGTLKLAMSRYRKGVIPLKTTI
jgi:hypothetical protein